LSTKQLNFILICFQNLQMTRYQQELAAKVKLGKDVFIAPNATVLGDITLGDNVSVWFGAIMRADMDTIIVEEKTNIQDGVIFHTDPGMPIRVGKGNIIGPGAIVHGCTIGDNNLIGIRSTVLNRAKIGNYCIIGAHALVTEDMEVPDFSMVLGSPGKIVKQLPEAVIDLLKYGTDTYVKEAMRYLESEYAINQP
jgi:carbonic anhydrase/acetyltransferase-like protein (isoleucine patch superfamily)